MITESFLSSKLVETKFQKTSYAMRTDIVKWTYLYSLLLIVINGPIKQGRFSRFWNKQQVKYYVSKRNRADMIITRSIYVHAYNTYVRFLLSEYMPNLNTYCFAKNYKL